MTGRQLRQATLHTASGRPVHMTVYRPDLTIDNLRLLASTYRAWRDQAAAIEATAPDAAFHAQFAAEVAWLAGSHLREWDDASDPHHYLIVVGVDDDTDEVLGINTAYFVPEEGVWYMAVGTTRPVDQPGYPNPDQVRGIGSEIIGAMVAEMNAIVCVPVTLEPLDEAAHRFWAARGFHDVGGDEMAMSCPESQELERRLAAAPPDCPDQGDCTATAGKKLRAAKALR